MAFDGCTGLTSVTIPNSVKEIESSAFSECTGLTSVTIPNSVKEIKDYTFHDCDNLTSITIPNSVTKIGDGAFSGCGISKITLPKSVTEIGVDIVGGCKSLTALYSLNTIPPKVGSIVFFGDKLDGFRSVNKALKVFVPRSALAAYKQAYGWKNFQNLQGFDPK